MLLVFMHMLAYWHIIHFIVEVFWCARYSKKMIECTFLMQWLGICIFIWSHIKVIHFLWNRSISNVTVLNEYNIQLYPRSERGRYTFWHWCVSGYRYWFSVTSFFLKILVAPAWNFNTFYQICHLVGFIF